MVKCSEVWEEGWESFDEVVANISTYLDCFELEKFEAVDSEEQLSKRGLELLDTNQLWGGLVRNSWNNTPNISKLKALISGVCGTCSRSARVAKVCHLQDPDRRRQGGILSKYKQ